MLAWEEGWVCGLRFRVYFALELRPQGFRSPGCKHVRWIATPWLNSDKLMSILKAPDGQPFELVLLTKNLFSLRSPSMPKKMYAKFYETLQTSALAPTLP